VRVSNRSKEKWLVIEKEEARQQLVLEKDSIFHRKKIKGSMDEK
jgi:hypothetical protein